MRRTPLTGFGRLLRDLAEVRGIYGWTALAEELQQAGWDSTRGTLSNWVHGTHPADYRALPLIVEVLELSKAEQQRLAWEFAFGQWPEPPRKKTS